MVSSKFSQRPRIQPLPPVCKKAPETTSCYDRPDEPPPPLHASGSVRATDLAGRQLNFITFSGFDFRYADYFWDFSPIGSNGKGQDVHVEWYRAHSRLSVDLHADLDPDLEETASWLLEGITDAFPWYIPLSETLTNGYIWYVYLVISN